MALIPATILTGFLGSGKTTLLKRILTEAHGQKIAVIENEFGEENIDSDILVTESKEQIVQMSNGCVCCTIREDLREALQLLAAKKRQGLLDFDRVVIETTGLADPGPVAQTFFTDEDVRARTRLDAIVTVIDAKHFFGQLEQGSEAEQQVAFADVILLNKTDLVSADELAKVEGKIRSINRYARIFRTEKSQIELEAILDKGAFDLGRILEFEPDFLQSGHDHNHEDEVASLSISTDRPVDPEKFQKWMGALLQIKGPDIFRSKGILAIDGAPRRYVYQGVHMMMDSDWGSPWKDGEARASKLVFIGRNLDGDNLKRGFEDCLKK